jgi:hypothetical protein
VKPTGNAHVVEEIKFSAEAFISFKNTYNPLSTFIRELQPKTSPIYIENLTVNLDEANNVLRGEYDILGAAQYKGDGKWVLYLGEEAKDLTLSAQEGNKIILTGAYAVGPDYKLTETITVNLPNNAENIKYDPEDGVVIYYLEPEKERGINIYAIGIGLIALGAVIVAYDRLLEKKEDRVRH